MGKERLVGSDGKLVVVTRGAVLTGDGIDDLNDLIGGGHTGGGWFEIVSLADSTSAITAGLSAGDLFWNNGTLVLSDGTLQEDEVRYLAEAEKADVTSFNLEISKAEIDVTTLADGVRRYRTGKIDMTGALEGITSLGQTDAAGWVLNNFIKIIKQATAGTVVVANIDDSPIYLKGVLQKDTASGQKESFFWAKVNLLGTSLGAQGEDAQGFSSNFRIAPGDPEPTFYVRTIA